MTVAAEAEREVQKAYWAQHSEECTVEAMMLDSQASVIDKEERPEARTRPLLLGRLAEIAPAGCRPKTARIAGGTQLQSQRPLVSRSPGRTPF